MEREGSILVSLPLFGNAGTEIVHTTQLQNGPAKAAIQDSIQIIWLNCLRTSPDFTSPKHLEKVNKIPEIMSEFAGSASLVCMARIAKIL